MKIDAILVKPLDGLPVGSPKSFDKSDFDRLKTMGAVRKAKDGDAVEPPVNEYDALRQRLADPFEGPALLREIAEISALRVERDEANLARDAAVDAERAAVERIGELTAEIEQLRAAKSETASDNKMAKAPSNKSSAPVDTK